MTPELRVERTFDATAEEIFDAWTSPEVLRRWWAPGPDWTAPLIEVDLRVGGRYRLATRNPQNGEVHTVGGEYKEIRRPDCLSYSWAWEDERFRGDSTVTVEFREQDGRTTVVLTHTGLQNDKSYGIHAHGWTEVLTSLERRVFAAADRA
jgi:uncharacterized protein YndB with AHSA1/START domain